MLSSGKTQACEEMKGLQLRDERVCTVGGTNAMCDAAYSVPLERACGATQEAKSSMSRVGRQWASREGAVLRSLQRAHVRVPDAELTKEGGGTPSTTCVSFPWGSLILGPIPGLRVFSPIPAIARRCTFALATAHSCLDCLQIFPGPDPESPTPGALNLPLRRSETCDPSYGAAGAAPKKSQRTYRLRTAQT